MCYRRQIEIACSIILAHVILQICLKTLELSPFIDVSIHFKDCFIKPISDSDKLIS